MEENKASAQKSVTETTPDAAPGRPEKALLRSLMREMFQSERSASRHCRVEASRIPNSPPARALEATARHADAVGEELPIRAKKHDLPVSLLGVALGSTFSLIRRSVVDYFMDSETSYRATLLGMRHGLDVMRTMREAALAAGEQELGEWCDRLYQARAPLVEECARQLTWFAQHADKAVQSVGSRSLFKSFELLKAQLGKRAESAAEQPAESKAG